MAWINRTYGHLRMGKRILVSSCDWMQLPAEMPAQSIGIVRLTAWERYVDWCRMMAARVDNVAAHQRPRIGRPKQAWHVRWWLEGVGAPVGY